MIIISTQSQEPIALGPQSVLLVFYYNDFSVFQWSVSHHQYRAGQMFEIVPDW